MTIGHWVVNELIVLATLCGVLAIMALLSGEFAAGVFLIIICGLWMFVGVNELAESKRKKSARVNSLLNNMFYSSPMIKEILKALDENGCYETISFEKNGSLKCERRKFYDDDTDVYYYNFEYEGEQLVASLDEQCELLKILKYYLPNGDTYHIQAAYDRREYEAFEEEASEGRGEEIAPPQPQYYMMFTDYYDDRRWNPDSSRWEKI